MPDRRRRDVGAYQLTVIVVHVLIRYDVAAQWTIPLGKRHRLENKNHSVSCVFLLELKIHYTSFPVTFPVDGEAANFLPTCYGLATGKLV